MSSKYTPENVIKETEVPAVSSQDTDYVSEDEQLHHLEKSGAINCVVGSQSMLSQELGGLSQDSAAAGVSDFNPNALLSQETTTAPKDESQEFLEFAKAARSKAAGGKPVSSSKDSSESQDSSTAKNADSQGSRSGADLGTLLTAVEIFTSQEQEQEQAEEVSKLNILSQEAGKSDPILEERKSSILQNHEGDQESQQCVFELLTSYQRNGKSYNQQTQIKPPPSIQPSPASSPKKFYTFASEPRKQKQQKENEKTKQQMLAKRAADLAQRTIEDPDLAKRLLLSMALTRENPRSPPSVLPGKGAVVPEGFFWAHYPPLEKVLKDNMAEYYELSITQCQSAQQQGFNNKLVELVRAETNRQQWVFDSCFTDKCLRDRIRCYFKTHIQNAKKRLRTMVKNPTKRANARHLCAHLDLIEKYGTSSAGRDKAIERKSEELEKKDERWQYAAPAWSVPSYMPAPPTHPQSTVGSDHLAQPEAVSAGPPATKRPRHGPSPAPHPNYHPHPAYSYHQRGIPPPHRPHPPTYPQRPLPTSNKVQSGSSSGKTEQQRYTSESRKSATVPIETS